MGHSPFFNAHHSPVGAFATLTFGCKGSRGGLASELKGPADEAFYVGLEEARRPGMYQCLPFFDGHDAAASIADYDVEGLSDHQHPPAVFHFPDSEVKRSLGLATDVWTAGDLTMTVYTPVRPLPDPDVAEPRDLRFATMPALIVDLEVDNSTCDRPRKVFLGYSGADKTRNMHAWSSSDGYDFIAQGTRTAMATRYPDAYSGVGFQPEAVLNPRYQENLDFVLGNTGLVVCTVPPETKQTIRFAVAFFEAGQATTGLEAKYAYARHFSNIEDVLAYALHHADRIVNDCRALDQRVRTHLGDVRANALAHAVKSYYGSTQLLMGESDEGRWCQWVVNEGEYRMMNTFDLTVDQLFFELALNPWTVRNVLDLFVSQYSYVDEVRSPDSDTLYPGGLAFCHDMGVANHFSWPGRSGYEQAGLRGVFSFMSCEELVNWTLCACLYTSHTRDIDWLKKNRETFGQVVTSLANRDNPDPTKRNGVMGFDSSRCQGGAEITTYDSLDKSLGQARNNLYLAVKTWAAYALVEEHLRTLGDTVLADLAKSQAKLCAQTIAASANEDGFLPAVIGEGNDALLIPAIEGLVFPYMAGRRELISPDGPYGDLRRMLECHFDLVMASGKCRFEDGGWRLSSTSRNSWLSKIYLCQFVAETILGKPQDTRADRAHWAWLMDEDNAYYAWSDQMLAGKAHGSRYYPRGVTAALWLAQGDSPLGAMREALVGKDSSRAVVL